MELGCLSLRVSRPALAGPDWLKLSVTSCQREPKIQTTGQKRTSGCHPISLLFVQLLGLVHREMSLVKALEKPWGLRTTTTSDWLVVGVAGCHFQGEGSRTQRLGGEQPGDLG